MMELRFSQMGQQVQEVRRAMRAMPDLERALGAARNAAAPLSLALPPQLLQSAQKK